jgi:hypothetical protein
MMMTIVTSRNKELEALPPRTCKAKVDVTSLQLAFYCEFVRTPVLKRPATAVVIACDDQLKHPISAYAFCNWFSDTEL